MKAELTKQFAKKTIRKTIVFVIIMIVISAVAQSMNPMVSNELALGQMQNSNEAFVLMDLYGNLRPLITGLYSCVILWFVYALGRGTYKFVDTIKTTENEKEN